MDSIASICNYLQAYLKKSDAQPAIFKLLITSTMETFGMMALAEQSVVSDEYGNFISTGSPSSRAIFDGSATCSSLNVQSPLVRLWRFYITSVQVRESNMSDYISAMSAILESVLTALSSRRKSISFLVLSLQANALTRDSPIISNASTNLISMSDKKAQCWTVLSKYIMDIFADKDKSSQSLLVDDRDLETELKNDLLLSAHRYAYDSDIANLAVSMFDKADDGLEFIEIFMRYLNEEMMVRGTTDRYGTLTAMIKQLQSLTIKYDRNDSVGRDLLGQTTRLMGDMMQIVFKEIRALTWGKKATIDDSFYSSIVSTLRYVNDAIFMSTAESYYNNVGCGIEGHNLTQRIMASKKPMFDFHMAVCKVITSRAQSSMDLLLAQEIKPIITFYLTSTMPDFAHVALAACANVLQSDCLAPLQLRLAIRAAKNTLRDARRKQIVDESIANINEKAHQEMQSIAERRSQSVSPIKEILATSSSRLEATHEARCRRASLEPADSESPATTAEPEPHSMLADNSHGKANSNGDVHPTEIETRLITDEAQSSAVRLIEQYMEVSVTAAAVEPDVFSHHGVPDSQLSIRCPSSTKPILANKGPSTAPLELRNELACLSMPLLNIGDSVNEHKADNLVRRDNCAQLPVIPQVGSRESPINIDQLDDSGIVEMEGDKTLKGMSNDVFVTDIEDAGVKVAPEAENDPIDVEMNDASGTPALEVANANAGEPDKPPHTSGQNTGDEKSTADSENLSVSRESICSMLADSMAATQPISESQASCHINAPTSDDRHADKPEEDVVADSQMAPGDIWKIAHDNCNERDTNSIANPVPSEEPRFTGESHCEVPSSSDTAIPAANSQHAIVLQYSSQSAQSDVKVTRRRVRKSSSARFDNDYSAVLEPAAACSVRSSIFAIIPPVSEPAPVLTDIHDDRSDHPLTAAEKKHRKRVRKSKQQRSLSGFEQNSGNAHVRQDSMNDCIVVSSNPIASDTPSPDIVIKRERSTMEDDEMANMILGVFAASWSMLGALVNCHFIARRKRGRRQLESESSESGDSSPVEPNETPSKKARVSKSSSAPHRIPLASLRHTGTRRKPSRSPSLTGADDDEEDEIQSSPVGGSLERYSDALHNSNEIHICDPHRDMNYAHFPFKFVRLSKQKFSSCVAQAFGWSRNDDTAAAVAESDFEFAGSECEFETNTRTGAYQTPGRTYFNAVSRPVVYDGGATIGDFLGRMRDLEVLGSDWLGQLTGEQKRELDAILLRMLWKTRMATDPPTPISAGKN
ncbi:hypothetical protein V1517DRAFT_376087 [Lipomyces orientalis]|uniref:Uncharacterized protein n=1 Tax=Lipomyces orientalis TaxID=1233043 RepID=A0ACC3TIG4_9ASCO